MAHLGGFSEDALKLFQEAASEQGLDFSEVEDTYDFTRCVRPDGSAYGTGGRCVKGSQEEKSPSEKLKEGSASNPSVMRREKDKALAAKKTADMYARSAERRAADEKAAGPKKMKTDFRKDVEEATAKRKEKEAKIAALQTRIADNKKAWQESEAKVREAKKAFQTVNSQTHGDKSPEARKRRLDAGRALDKAERAAEKASKMFLGAQKAMKMFTMTPEQRKAEREWSKTKKMYG